MKMKKYWVSYGFIPYDKEGNTTNGLNFAFADLEVSSIGFPHPDHVKALLKAKRKNHRNVAILSIFEIIADPYQGEVISDSSDEI